MKTMYLVVGVAVVVLVGGVFFAILKKPSAPTIKTQTQTRTQIPTQTKTIPDTFSDRMTLTVSSPANNSVVTSPLVVIKGKTAPKAEVSVNDKEVVADVSGNFSASLTLDEGINYLEVVAVDGNGNSASSELAVTYDIGQ